MNQPSQGHDATASREHLKTLDTIRKAKNLFLFLTVLAPLMHVGAWAAVQFGGVLESDVTVAQMERDSGREEGSDLEKRQAAMQWENAMLAGMSLAEFAGRIGITMLLTATLLAVLVNLAGRLGGASDFVASFFVAVVVAMLFVPWERMSAAPPNVSPNVFGVFTTLEKLKQHFEANMHASPDAPGPLVGMNVGLSQQKAVLLVDALRFAVMPAIAILLALISGVRFGRGYREARRQAGGDIPMKVV
ncbi:MAG: hypothetical protein HUU22_04270 [Phycisphaerae bacterium]|nr:hypothetical protein [Phycisphaerae bacterium]NUQ45233.1 hypothetical protein [Phycisphaerae bacterium]